MKVLILSYETINNIGEELLGVCTEWLVHKNSDATTLRAQLVPNYRVAFKYNWLALMGIPLQYVALRLAKRNIKAHSLWKLIYCLRLQRYYEELISQCDKVILAVGMLKFKNQNFSYIFDIICQIASKYNKKVLFSSMSVARPDVSDVRFHQLVEAINMPCVWGVSTRDGGEGLSILKNDYIKRESIVLKDVGDPALWVSEVYNCEKKGESDVIGINVIDPSIYERYGQEIFSREQVESLYEDVINELQNRGYNIALYCNGMECDYDFGKQLIKRIETLNNNNLLPRPHNVKEYLSQVKNFSGIFGARLHADIVAYSLGIPFVGLLWDSKLKNFARQICKGGDDFLKNNMLPVSELRGENVADKLVRSIGLEYDEEIKDYYKEKTENFIRSFLVD